MVVSMVSKKKNNISKRGFMSSTGKRGAFKLKIDLYFIIIEIDFNLLAIKIINWIKKLGFSCYICVVEFFISVKNYFQSQTFVNHLTEFFFCLYFYLLYRIMYYLMGFYE
jgi:hypothetical protein